MSKVKIASLVAIVGLVGVFAAPAQSDPPEGRPPPQPVIEQNLDENNGAIRVHEQGIADVNVTNFPSSQDVRVTNLPGTQDVNVTGGTLNVNVTLPPVTRLERHTPSLAAGEGRFIPFSSTINATTFSVSTLKNDEYTILFTTPLSPRKDFLAAVFTISNPDGDDLFHTESFMYPVPLDGVQVSCQNESDDCRLWIEVVGF